MRLQVSSNNISFKIQIHYYKPNSKTQRKREREETSDPCFIFSKTLFPTRFLQILVFLRCF
ncbi:hypothetical protein HanPI659440_Chr04g0143621 [Helianthus annuus]|nr:hypothetical protein HanPI659440_Chr04g0143621 [Helianthus annuus]